MKRTHAARTYGKMAAEDNHVDRSINKMRELLKAVVDHYDNGTVPDFESRVLPEIREVIKNG